MEIGRELLLHADRGASSAYISRNGEEIFHGYHLDLLVAGNLGQGLQVYFSIAWNHAYKVSASVSVQHQCLEHALDRLTEAVRHMLCSEIVFIEFIWDEVI